MNMFGFVQNVNLSQSRCRPCADRDGGVNLGSVSLLCAAVKLEGRVMVRAHLHMAQATSEVYRPPAPPHSLTHSHLLFWRSRHRFAFYNQPTRLAWASHRHTTPEQRSRLERTWHLATSPRARSGCDCAHMHRFRSSSGTGRQTLRPRERDRDRDRAHLPRVGTP